IIRLSVLLFAKPY
ncbi:ribosomal-protein-alanine N-acetyltransferase, partial [Haemophilus influenzae]